MATGLRASSMHSRNWRSKKDAEGFKRIILWLPPEVVPQLEHYAFEAMVPNSVAVEMIVKKYFEKEGD